MARTHGKILCRIWQDPTFKALTLAEQWSFVMLLSQPRISLVGSIDYYPDRWATFAGSLTQSEIETAVKGLEHTGFVCLDLDTRELLVRSFTRNDGITIANPKLRKGLWGAFEAIYSDRLRKVAVDNMPDELFAHEHPDEAARLRRSARIEWPHDCPIDHPHDSSCLHPPATCHQSTAAIAESVARTVEPVDNPPPADRIPDEVIDEGKAQVNKLRHDLRTPRPPDTTHGDHEASPPDEEPTPQ